MKFILSPAKSLNIEKQTVITESSSISFPDKTEKIMKKLKKLSAKQIGELMKVSANISDLNFDRFQNFSTEFTKDNSKQAMLAFDGPAYKALDTLSFDKKDVDFAQENLRILSGLYGVLKPLDLIQPYRLEMSTRIAISANEKNLYEVWKETSTAKMNEALDGSVLVNLASNEYFKSIDTKKLKGDLLTIGFKDFKSNLCFGNKGIIAFVRFTSKNSLSFLFLQFWYKTNPRKNTGSANKAYNISGFSNLYITPKI